jgi:hypothetical protein
VRHAHPLGREPPAERRADRHAGVDPRQAVSRGSGEFLSGNDPWSYQKLLVQGADGLYTSSDASGVLASMTDQNDAAILILDLTQGTNAGFYWSGYTYSDHSFMMNDTDITVYGGSYVSMNGMTFYHFGDGLFTPASFASLYIVD